MTRPAIVCVALLVCATALGLRLPALVARPMHADEAVQAVRLVDFIGGNYKYDPNEFHGPALYVFAAPIALLQGKATLASLNETDLRLASVLAGVGTIVLLFFLRDAFGIPAIAVAGAIVAVSPAFAFYSRYFIHESLMVFLTLATLVSLWRYRRRHNHGWAIAAAAFFALLYSTKTTWIIAAVAAIAAALVTAVWQRRAPRGTLSDPAHPRGPWWQWPAALALFAIIVVLLFSDFLRQPGGIGDSIRTFVPSLDRGLGRNADAAIHVHPWYFYLQELLYLNPAGPPVHWSAFFSHPSAPIWSHGMVALLALVGAAAAFGRHVDGVRIEALRFLLVFTVLLWLMYSLIPYKTPWLVLTPLLPLTMLAGVGAVVLWQRVSQRLGRALFMAALAGGLANLAWQSCAANFVFASDPQNPYVYAHTSNDIFNLADRVRAIAAVDPDHNSLPIDVVGDGIWPLPWYLRQYPHTGYWRDLPPPTNPLDGTPLIIATREMDAGVQQNLHRPYARQFFQLRPNVLILLYTRQDLLDAAVAGQPAAPSFNGGKY
jgi:uncharacterized protein (TIGR03663 family)